MASRKSTLHARRGPRWPSPDAANAAAGTRTAKTASRPPQPAAEGSARIDPLTLWRSTLTPTQLAASLASGGRASAMADIGIPEHALRRHAELFGWRHGGANGDGRDGGHDAGPELRMLQAQALLRGRG